MPLPNKAHIVYLGECCNSDNDLLFLGTVANDAALAQLIIDGAVEGSTVVVANSEGNSGEPTFYHYNGDVWEIIGSPGEVVDVDAYTEEQIDNFFLSLGWYPPIATNSGGDFNTVADGTPITGGVVLARNVSSSGKSGLYRYSGSAWVLISLESWGDTIATLVSDLSTLTDKVATMDTWRNPVADITALLAVSAPQANEVRQVLDNGYGIPSLFRYTGGAWKIYYQTPVCTFSQLAAIAASARYNAIDNMLWYVSDEACFYYYDVDGTAWIKVGDASELLYSGAVPGGGIGANGDYHFNVITKNLSFKAAGAWSIIMHGDVVSAGNFTLYKAAGNVDNSVAEAGDVRIGHLYSSTFGFQYYDGASWSDVGPTINL